MLQIDNFATWYKSPKLSQALIRACGAQRKGEFSYKLRASTQTDTHTHLAFQQTLAAMCEAQQLQAAGMSASGLLPRRGTLPAGFCATHGPGLKDGLLRCSPTGLSVYVFMFKMLYVLAETCSPSGYLDPLGSHIALQYHYSCHSYLQAHTLAGTLTHTCYDHSSHPYREKSFTQSL
ncbi:hypothetical protein AMECASPLE_028305 [Ameca splendens]|uniref:Uncharacterized protein n=1 Tax=Ameca splendens TaxID=208324 RepID=A0ABV0ZQZ4_9TELE